MDASFFAQPVSSAISGAFGLIGQSLQYKYNKKLAEQQNQYNLDMWNLQNEYNSPQAQMRRYEEAGLNPALIYSQGNPGNASSAPQMVTPNAPEFSKDMRELANAFNIEGLRTIIANRKKAQAEARNASTNAERNDLELAAEKNVGLKYTFDPTTGRFVERPLAPDGKAYLVHPSAYYANRILSDNFRTNFLLMPRRNLIGSQRDLNVKRQELFAPQIRYWNFNTTPWRMKTNFWIGNVKSGLQAVAPFVTPFL